MLIITVVNNFLGLEFLYVKGGIIHGDVSMNNVMINRVWDCESDNMPSRLRMIACTLKQLAIDANNSNSDSAVTTKTQASAISATQALVIDTSTVHAAATSTTVTRTPTVSELTPITEAHDTSLAPAVLSANTVSVAQVSASSVIDQTPASSEEPHFIAVPTALTYHGPTHTSLAAVQANTNTELGAVVQEPTTAALALREHSSNVVDWTGTTEHIESSGMIIDGDFMQYKSQETNLTSVRKPAPICDYVY